MSGDTPPRTAPLKRAATLAAGTPVARHDGDAFLANVQPLIAQINLAAHSQVAALE